MAAKGQRGGSEGKSTPVRHTASFATCVHPYYKQWAGRCEGCLRSPLSPNLPDHHNPNRPSITNPDDA
jgi:hypothetical protein